MSDRRWSQYVQTVSMMETSRRVRFTPRIAGRLIEFLQMRGMSRVLEVGCGPGVLTRALADACPDGSFVGLDRDMAFVQSASEIAATESLDNVQFIHGNALQLPFGEGTFDCALSYTVLEHVPTLEFLKEQKRVLKPDGTVATLSMFPQNYLHSVPDNLPQPTAREDDLMSVVEDVFELTQKDAEIGVAKWAIKPHEIPALFAQAGLAEVRVDAMAIPECIGPYNEESPRVLAMQSTLPLEHIRLTAALEKAYAAEHGDYTPRISKELQAELAMLIKERFAKRAAMRDGDAQWEVHVGLMLAVVWAGREL